MLSTQKDGEPRFQITENPRTQQIFGIDVEGLAPGQEAVIDEKALGYPLESIRLVPPGKYRVQALIHKYETFHRADGHSVKLPMDRGEGQHWNRAPGNLYSTPKEITIEPANLPASGTIAVKLDKVIPPIPDPPATKYIKHEKIQSERLTKFWGRPMHLGAHVLLPEGFDEHPKARYPLAIFHGHFPQTFGGFREEPPDPNLKPEYSERFHLQGYNRIEQELAHQFYKEWTGPDFPRMIIIEIQHANPYYDDSYAVNSENLGPYGDAITYELIPYLEKKYRCLGTGWSRFLYGGSTGGWEALAVQLFYPDEYNGCFAACPDPIDFRAYTVVNLYEDKNAYYDEGPWHKVARPGMRNYLGHISSTVEDINRYELVLGTRSRSGEQWDIWEAVYSPVGPDGYPKPIWDKTHRRHRPRGGQVLARALRPGAYHRARLGEDRQETRGEDPHLRRRHGQLLPEQRRLPGGGHPQEGEGPGLRRRSRLWRSGGALLERRPHPTQCASAGSATTRCSRRGSSSGSSSRPRRGATSRAGDIDRCGGTKDRATTRRGAIRCGIPSLWD